MHLSVLNVLPLVGFFSQVSCAAVVAACPSAVTGSFPSPSVAPGYAARLIAKGLHAPRGLIFDSAGHLLVVQQGSGVQALTLTDNGGDCVSVASNKNVISDSGLNHGIQLSPDNSILYVSSVENVYQYAYNPSTASVSGPGRIIINNMTNGDHVTRTLLLSKKQPGTLIVSRGSGDNIDADSLNVASGHASIKAFNVVPPPATPYNHPSTGKLLGWGLRNDVGVAEHPVTGGIWSVENSADNVARYGVDFHENNPGEELNYLGTLVNNASPNQGKNFGYPSCLAAWNASAVPQAPGLKRGQQFALNPTSSLNDAYCKSTPIAPRLVFTAHMAPLDIKFLPDGSAAFVTFHGSYDRSIPKGYKVVRIPFENGQPTHPSTSAKGAHDIVKNTGFENCNPSTCFRPVGLALYTKNRLIFSSDATGELYVIVLK